MSTHVMAYTPFGAEGIIIRVEADIRRGIPGIDITGLAEGAVREARERVRAAFRNSSLVFPQDRVLINLAPADVRKEGAALDLPIALAVMAAAGLISVPATGGGSSDGNPSEGDTAQDFSLDNLMVLGELELSGRLRPVRGVLAAVAAGLRSGIRDFMVPAENAREAAVLAEGRFYAPATLSEAVHAFMVRCASGSLPAAKLPVPPAGDEAAAPAYSGDFADVRGQKRYKRALEIAAAGGHNLLVFGPPGGGKTMLARRLPSIMPDLETAEAVEVTRLYSLAGQIDSVTPGGSCLITRPPFRFPHHSASAEGILGGGKTIRPGEISLAHLGVLFLDEAPEFRSNVLQALREPLEDRVVTISRADGSVKLPADFQLILAANPCPCGRLGIRGGLPGSSPPAEDPAFSGAFASGCFCSSDEISRYWRRFGAALLDRIELRTAVLPPSQREEADAGEESAVIARRVAAAAAVQRERFKGTDIRRNARLPAALIQRYCRLDGEGERAFRNAAERLCLSGRAFHGILRTARTIADLEGSAGIQSDHILEAVQYRRSGDDPYDILAAG